MKRPNVISTILLLLWLPLLNGQDSYTFLSNLHGDDHPPSSLTPHLKNSKVISLGDMDETILSYRIDKKLSTLGDRDILRKYKEGRLTLENINKKRACPGPVIEELDDHHVLIAINSNWFIDEEYSFIAANEDCDYFNQVHMLEALEETLEDYDEWNKIIITHHPIKSISELNGQGLSAFHLLPFYGQLYTSYRKNIGHAQSLPRHNYQRYIHMIDEILEKFDKVCFITGHDKVNAVIQEKNITYININTGSKHYRMKRNKNTLYASSRAGLLSLQFSRKGAILTIHENNHSYQIPHPFQKRKEEIITKDKMESVVRDSIAASKKYDASGLKKLLMGQGYRDEWSTKIKAPLLDIDEYEGGLTPYAIGGGLQTMSIKFKAANGKKYAFRVLDKRPEKAWEKSRENLYIRLSFRSL